MLVPFYLPKNASKLLGFSRILVVSGLWGLLIYGHKYITIKNPIYESLLAFIFIPVNYWCATEGVNRILSLGSKGRLYIENQKKWVAACRTLRKSQGLSYLNVFMDGGYPFVYYSYWFSILIAVMTLGESFKYIFNIH